MNINANRRDPFDRITQGMQGVGAMTQGCCFIFLESYNGLLPWWVRKCRDAFYTKERREGYVWMSKWLVPMMERHSFIRNLVNDIMITPLTAYGGALYCVKGYEYGSVYKPVASFWFKLWDILGRVKGGF